MPLLFSEKRYIMFKPWLRNGLAVCLALILCFSNAPRSYAQAFSDVSQDHWAYEEITAMAERGLIQGANGAFRPGDSVSIQAFLSMLCRASGFDDRDLEQGADWSDPALAYGQYFGWFNDDELNQENRAAPITREFAAKLLVNALFADQLSSDALLSFRDAHKIDRSCVSQVKTAVQLGLIGGYEDGYFHPEGTLSRAAAAALLHRALALKENTQTDSSIQVPILMYHDISYLGSGYSKTPEIFKAQMEELKNAGFHTIFYSQLIDYVENGTPLPEKPVIISIDDGYQTNYTYVFPILKELNMKAEISLIGDAILYADWGMDWAQVQEMQASNLVAFQAHTKSLHGDHTAQGGRLGVLKTDSESWDTYVEILGNDTKAVLDLIENEIGIRPQVFTYPRGKWNSMSEGIVSGLGCKVSVTTKDGIACVTQGVSSSLRLMDRIGMDFRNGSVVSVLKQFGYQG